MRSTSVLSVVLLCILTPACLTYAAPDIPLPGSLDIRSGDSSGRLLYKAQPTLIRIAELGAWIDGATITDVEILDFNGDGRKDIAVAWYATDYNNMLGNNLRFLTILIGEGTSFSRLVDINLYVPDYGIEAKSIFRNGTSDIGVGDFDGDGDPDLAVTPFFGDELWFIENRGGGRYAKHLKFPFGYNSTGNFMTPPEVLAADFNGDGRDDLVYLTDPIQRYDDRIVHFWKTNNTINNIARVEWWTFEQDVEWVRGLTVADFDGDERPDICFSGSNDIEELTDPILSFWYDLNPGNGLFSTYYEYPSVLCSDIVALQPDLNCPPGVLLADLNGTTVQHWPHTCAGGLDFVPSAEITGYASLSADRGMAMALADVDGDGDLDLVTKQKLASTSDSNQIEITLSAEQGTIWTRVDPTPIDTTGFRTDQYNGILRPQNLAVADLYGNTLPEIVAGFYASESDPSKGARSLSALDIAIWGNSCLGDATLDGRTNNDDVVAVNQSLGSCHIGPRAPSVDYNPNADIDKSGCIDEVDLDLVQADLGCECYPCVGQLAGDANCDGTVNTVDIWAFSTAISSGEDAWLAIFGNSGCDFLCVNDLNGDGLVNALDVDMFVNLFKG